MTSSRKLELCLLSAVLAGCTTEGCEECEPLRIEPATLPRGTVGKSYSEALHVPCWEVDWSFRSGALPPGIEFSQEGVVRGTPTLAGEYAFTVGIVVDELGEDVDGDEHRQRYHLVIEGPAGGSGGGGAPGEGGMPDVGGFGGV